MAKRVFFVFVVLTILTSVYSITRGSVQQARAATPATLNFQARLMTSSGNLVPDGNYNIEFKLYNTVTSAGSSQGSCTGDANCLWTETLTGGDQVEVRNGYLSAYLGDVTALPSNIWDQQLWLTMNIGGTGLAVWDGEMTPRIRMTSVPYAFQAKSAETLNKNTGSFTGTVDFATLTADRRYLFPDTSLATTASPGTICVYNGAASNCPAASGSAYYIQNDTVLQTQSNFNIQGRDDALNPGAGTVVGVLQGAAAGQTVDLLQFKSSGGTVLGAVTSTGNLQVATGLDTYTGAALSIGGANATAVSIGDTGITTTVNGALTVTEAFTANGGATITGITNINTTGTAATTIGNAAAGITLDGAVTVNETATFNDTVTVAAGQTIQLVGGATNTRPASPLEGMVYFDTDTKQLLVYANGKWQADRNANSMVVAASTASQAVKDAADYVADGTNDEVQINLALTAGAGSTVYLTGGTFVVNSTLLIPSNTVLAGAGESTIVQLNAGSGTENLIENKDTPGTNLIIRDMKLDGSLGTGGTQHAIYLNDVSTTATTYAVNEIERVITDGWSNGDGLYITGSSVINGVAGNGLSSVNVNSTSAIFNFTRNAISGDISVDSSTISTFADNVINGTTSFVNTSQLLALNGNFMGLLTVDTSTALSINDNTIGGIDLNALSGPVNIIGNRIGSTTTDALEITNTDGARIIGNYFYDDGAAGLSIDITDVASDNTYIADNELGGLAINDSGTGTVYGGQLSGSNFVIQPAGNVLLNANTTVDGDLTVTGLTTTNSLDVTADAGVGGNLTVDGTITVSTLGATNTDAVVCLNSSGQLAACNSTFLTATDIADLDNAFLQGGNAFGASAVLGTTDNNDLSLIANNITALTIDVTGNTTFMNDTTFNGSVTLAANQTLRLTGGVTGNRPGSPTEGMMYFDTTTKQLLIYANGKWQADTKTATFVVAASNSSQSDKDGAQYVADGEDSSGSGIGTLDGDQVQINSALNAAESAGGGVVYLMGGTYTVDAAIAVPNNVTLVGTGAGSLVQLGNFGATSVSINAIASKDTSTGTSVKVRELRIDGRSSINTNGTQAGITFTGVGDRTAGRAGGSIENVVVDNFRTYGIFLNNSAGNIVTNVSTNGSAIGLQTAGTAYTNTISDNTFNGGNYGVVLAAGGNLVSNNVIYGSAIAGIYVSASLNSITANLIGTTGGATTMNSIYITGAGATDNSVTNNAMSDNSCSTNCYAIYIDAASVRNYLADNSLGTNGLSGTVNNLAGTSTILAGQLSSSISGNYQIQPAGTIELMKNTNVTGVLTASTSVLTPTVDTATATTLNIGTTTANAVSISRTGVTTTVNGALTVTQSAQFNGGLTVSNGGNVAFQRGASDYAGTGTVNDVNFGTGALFRITSASAVTITSIAGGTDGRLITLINASANTVTLSNNTGATLGNRIITGTGASVVIPTGASLTLAYDSADSRWRVIGSTASTNGYVQLAPGTAQADTSANASVFINDTGGGNLLQLQSGGVNKFVVSADGATTISNASTSTALQITQTGNTSASTSTGGALNINNTGNTGAGLVIYSNQATPSGRLFVVRADQATFNQSAAYIDMGGSGAGLTIAQSNVAKGGNGGSGLIISNDAGGGTTAAHGISVNLTGSGNASASAANFVSSNTAHSAVQISGAETGRGTLKITHTGTGTDGNASAISIDLQGSGTASQGIFLDSTTGTTGKLLNIRNAGTEYLTLDANGQLGLNTSGTPTARLDVRGTALFAGDSASFLRIQNSSSQTLFVADTSSQRVAIGPAAVAANSILTIGTNTTAASGGIYFGTDTNLYRSAAGELRTDGNLSLGQGANRTLSVQTRTSNAAGNNLTVSAGNAGAGASAFGGGTLNLQGGSAAGTGNANGGGVVIAGGTGAGTGYQGLVNLSTTAFSSSTTVTAPAGVTNVGTSFIDLYSTIPVNATATTAIVSISDPGVTTIGRVLYVSALRTSTDFTLRLNAASTPIDIAMKANSTATLIWNGERWTAAGASSSTDLQSAYNNTLTSAGGAELVLNAPGANADGFTIRNNASTPIVGGLLEVQTSIGTNLFSVNNRGTEHANNGGAETAGGSSTTFPANTWTAAPVSATIARTITAGQYVTGQAGVSVATTASTNSGVRNNLSGTISNTIGAEYQVSFTAKSSVNGTPIDVIYSRDGGTSTEICTEYSSQTLSDSAWTKITCTVTISSATAPTDADLIIRKTNGTTPVIYIDNLSFQRNDTSTQPSNVQIGGGNDGGPITLFTLDRASAPPVAAGDETYYGSMYYDTITGSIQCYEADGWGACGSPPDNIITLTPEYTGAVLNGNGIGVLTADFCTNENRTVTIQINTDLCDTLGEARNYYRWTSPQATLQEYSIYVNYKLPNTFKEFATNNTMRLTAYRDDADDADALVQMTTYRKNVSGTEITQCGTPTDITNSIDDWEETPVAGNENSCGFVGGDYIIFKITMKSRSNANVYVENLDFTFNNR